MKLFKKLFVTLSIALTSIFCLASCGGEIHKYSLESIDVSSYVKEEAHISGAHVFFLIFGSYSKNTKVIQRYIFLAKNGQRDSYKINDIHVYSNEADEPMSGKLFHVYFKYIEPSETPYVEYSHDKLERHYYYWLCLPRENVLELAQDMFRDL